MRISIFATGVALLLALASVRPAAAVCGDGVRESLEECDDGNLAAGDCCTPTCTKEPDLDGDALCDALDPCSSPIAAFVRGRLSIAKLGAPSGDERVRIKGEFVVSDDTSVDPVADGVTALIHDGLGQTIFSAMIPPGAFDPMTRAGWQTNGHVWIWRNSATALRKVVMKLVDGDARRVRFVGVGRDVPAVTPEDAPVTLTLITSGTSSSVRCAQVSLGGENGEGRCVLLNGSQRLICR